MAIEMVKQPQGFVDAGLFNLPPCFKPARWAAKWVREGAGVLHAEQRESLAGFPATADGWVVYKREGGKICKVATQKDGNYILMYRPREVQDGVNAIYGNMGKQRMLAEKQGETVGGISKQEGMLGESDLAQVEPHNLADDAGTVTLNQVPGLAQSRVTATAMSVAAATIETETETKTETKSVETETD
jgi:hypothetical protein